VVHCGFSTYFCAWHGAAHRQIRKKLCDSCGSIQESSGNSISRFMAISSVSMDWSTKM